MIFCGTNALIGEYTVYLTLTTKIRILINSVFFSKFHLLSPID